MHSATVLSDLGKRPALTPKFVPSRQTTFRQRDMYKNQESLLELLIRNSKFREGANRKRVFVCHYKQSDRKRQLPPGTRPFFFPTIDPEQVVKVTKRDLTVK